MARNKSTADGRVARQVKRTESTKADLKKAKGKIRELELSVEREKKRWRDKEDELNRRIEKMKNHETVQTSRIGGQEEQIYSLKSEFKLKRAEASNFRDELLNLRTQVSTFKSVLTGIIQNAQNPRNLPGLGKRKKFFLDTLSEVHSLAAKELPCESES